MKKAETLFLIFLFLFCLTPAAGAAEKVFSGAGDGSAWTDKDNWFSTGIPTANDSVVIDLSNASVTVSKDFKAQSIIIGGKTTSTFTSQDFVYGEITPASSADAAIYIRKNGTVTLKGSGTITAKGSFKNSEEALVSEPSVMILLS